MFILIDHFNFLRFILRRQIRIKRYVTRIVTIAWCPGGGRVKTFSVHGMKPSAKPCFWRMFNDTKKYSDSMFVVQFFQVKHDAEICVTGAQLFWVIWRHDTVKVGWTEAKVILVGWATGSLPSGQCLHETEGGAWTCAAQDKGPFGGPPPLPYPQPTRRGS